MEGLTILPFHLKVKLTYGHLPRLRLLTVYASVQSLPYFLSFLKPLFSCSPLQQLQLVYHLDAMSDRRRKSIRVSVRSALIGFVGENKETIFRIPLLA